MTNPYVFVVGCPRSGTTLLQRMLDAHPRLTVANDTHFITRAVKSVLKRDANPPMSSELVDLVLAYRRFRRMGLSEAEVRDAAHGCNFYSEFVSRLYTLRGRKIGKSLSGEKTPDFCRQMPQLHTLFPKARFVHIIRDGRNTALSAVNWATDSKGPGKWETWREDSIGTCALWWRWQVSQGLRDGARLPDGTYQEVLYEDLVAEPESRLAYLADFLGLEDAREMAEFHAGKTRNHPGLSAKSAWLPPTQGLRDWTNQMNRVDLQVFEGVAGGLLQQLGYSLSGLETSMEAVARIKALEHWWLGQKMSRDLQSIP